jgi:hypothetical protein
MARRGTMRASVKCMVADVERLMCETRKTFVGEDKERQYVDKGKKRQIGNEKRVL